MDNQSTLAVGESAPTEPITAPEPTISDAQLAANRANALLSTGPTSTAGLKKVSFNAVKTALTGRTVLLEGDDSTAYQSLLNAQIKDFEPIGTRETALVQSLTDILWRLDRIPALEQALIIDTRAKLVGENPALLEELPPLILESRIRLIHEKQFRNYQLQENRLANRRVRETKELEAMQTVRKSKEEKQKEQDLTRAAQAALLANHHKQTFSLSANGFVFSPTEVRAHLAKLSPSKKENLLQEALAKGEETTEALQIAA
jgi:hypothetical protein